ncbi:MAG TPA: putative glycolipid-binding domain-containing protein [Actinomycetes bacterium]|nr:putative glycolipid-binding domain-containing protein [Actinomycetes bacterium]
MGTVLWQGVETGALDRCTMEAGRDGLRLSGIVLTPEHGTPLDVRYLVETGPDGLTRRVELALDGGATRRALLADGAGSWRWEDGDGLPEVDGALDVDLTVTPATNTLPIRRLAALETGQEADFRMAWVQFPGLEVLASAQRYQRLAPDRWHFSTGDFHAELLVDPYGLVLDYGGLFRTLAYRLD